jgi:hypothetical protein
VTVIARVLCATAQSEHAALTMPGFPLQPGASVYVAEPPSATDAYAVLVSRLDRRSWRVRVIDRASGVVARSEWFEEEAAARRRHEELSGAARSLDAAAFRARYRLP